MTVILIWEIQSQWLCKHKWTGKFRRETDCLIVPRKLCLKIVLSVGNVACQGHFRMVHRSSFETYIVRFSDSFCTEEHGKGWVSLYYMSPSLLQFMFVIHICPPHCCCLMFVLYTCPPHCCSLMFVLHVPSLLQSYVCNANKHVMIHMCMTGTRSEKTLQNIACA